MGRAIIKIKDKLFLWSTIVDAPVTYGCTPEQMKNEFIRRAVEEAEREFNESMKLVEENGHAFRFCFGKSYSTVEDVISGNRAGPNETELTLDEIYEKYGEPPKEEEKT